MGALIYSGTLLDLDWQLVATLTDLMIGMVVTVCSVQMMNSS